MIYLTKGQPLADNAGLVVCDPTGYYNDGDSVACAPFHMPDEPIYRYEAKFIAYGGMVYEIADEDKLLEEVKKINPETLFGKNKEEVAVDKVIEDIVTQESGEMPNKPTVEEVTIPAATDYEITNSAPTEPKQVPEATIVGPVPGPTSESSESGTTTDTTPSTTVPVADEIVDTVTKITSTVEKIVNVGSDLGNLSQ